MSENKNNGALELILLRNSFYRDNYRRAIIGFLILVVINCLLLGAIVYKISSPPKPQYFATTASGRMINWHPLTDPAVPDSFVTQWAANAVRKAFSLDYIHWRHQLQEASDNFTNYGWKTFLAALKKSNNLTTLTSLKMVSNAKITEPAFKIVPGISWPFAEPAPPSPFELLGSLIAFSIFC